MNEAPARPACLDELGPLARKADRTAEWRSSVVDILSLLQIAMNESTL